MAPLMAARGLRILVGQASRHLTQRGQAVPLLHLLVELGVLDHQGAAVAHPEEGGDLVRGEGLRHPLVPAGQEADHPVAGEKGDGDAGLHGGHHLAGVGEAGELLGHGSGGPPAASLLLVAARPRREQGSQLRHAAVQVLEQDGLLAGGGGGEQRAGGARLEEGHRGRAAVVEQPVARPVLGEEPEGGVGDPPRLDHPVERGLGEAGRIDDVPIFSRSCSRRRTSS